MVREATPGNLSPEFAADSLTNDVGTVSAIQKRRLSATLEPTHSSTKSKRSKKPRKRSEHEIEDDLLAVPKVPENPNKIRNQASASVSVAPLLSTPNSSQVNLIADNNPNPTTPEKATPSRRRRKVEPHATNAPLQTPGGSRITTYPSQVFEADFQTPSQQTDILTTDNVLEKACAHLISIDPRLKTVIDQHHCRMFSPEGLAEEVEPFIALASGIIGQQVRRK
jgi:DNA-3-methyladenine glycosylase II